MRGFVFTIDSFVALALALFAISAMLYVSGSRDSSPDPNERLYLIADDSMDVLGGVKAAFYSQNALSDTETALESIGWFVSKGELGEARTVSGKVLEPIIPSQFGFSVEYEKNGEWTSLYSRPKEMTTMVASSVRVVFGSRSLGEKETLCENESCPFCNGLPRGGIEPESFGPLLVRVRLWT